MLDTPHSTAGRDHRLDLLTRHLPMMVAHCDRDLHFTYVNNAYAERFGLTPDALIGRSIVEVLGEEAFGVIRPHVERAIRGERVEYEAWIPFAGLGRRYMRCIYVPETTSTGEVVGYMANVFDDTRGRDIEDALASTRARFDFVAKSAEVGVWSCDLPFAELIWNQACKGHFGLPPEATVTIETFYERMHPEDVAPTRQAIDTAIASGTAYDVEYRTLQQDGSYRWIRAIGRADYDHRGQPHRFEGVTLDITAAKRIHESFRELADAMPQIVWSADAQGNVDYLNRRWYELTGKAAGDLDTMGVVHPADRDAARAAFRRSVETGEDYQHEYRLCLPGFAEPRWFLGRARPARDQNGRIVRWYATSTDIHEQKETEVELLDSRDRLRAALDASSTGTFRWDIESNELDWDDNLDRLFGLAPGATARSLAEFVRLVHPDDRQCVLDACARCAADNVDFAEEYRVVWPDGTVRWLFDKGRVFIGPNGRYMSGACVDITDRRLKEDALRAADRQKDEFLGMLAHEIRNPLAPMMYSATILEQRLQDPAAKRPLEVITRQATRMIRIVDDLLDVSRVTQGKIALKREPVDVSALVAQCVEATRPRFEARRHTLELTPSGGALTVLGDAVRLAQVVENLLINAAKYTPDGGRIEIGAAAEAGMAVITVRDTGIGIAPEMIGRVFDLFAQADTSLDRSEGGLGIGLTLVDRLARMHGGDASVWSAGLGRGTTFAVRLPLLAA
jgi:PAS domain S-box-containing protein